MPRKFNPFSDPVPTTSTSTANPAPYHAKLFEHLQQGNTINFVQARELGINNLDRHVADLQKRTKVHARLIRINGARCWEYSLQPFT